MTIELRVDGEPAELPAGLDLAAYRIVQEGLTNALRHSGGTLVRILLRYLPSRLEIEVLDDGRGPVVDGSGESGAAAGTDGHGLIGVRERVAIYGGTAELTAVPDGGTRLAASLPLTGVT